MLSNETRKENLKKEGKNENRKYLTNGKTFKLKNEEIQYRKKKIHMEM
jgi:hypothetical protein